MYAELEALERRVMAQILHIQQVKLELNGGAYQPEEQLEGVGDMPTQEELTEETNMSEKEAEQQLTDETAELEPTTGWKDNATKEEENNIQDQYYLPTDKEELQPRRLYKKSQPLEQLDRVIEKIRELMLRSVEVDNKGKMKIRETSIATGKKQKRKQ
jgi:hypothetical protein